MTNSNKRKFIRMGETKERALLDTQYESGKAPYENAYGEVMSWDEESGKYLPVICGHGGSMWLCRDCAEELVKGGQR